MKKLLFVLFGSVALVFGCSDESVEPANEENPAEQNTQVDTNNKNKPDEQKEIVLNVIKEYSEENIDLEAYYINEEINASHEEGDIQLTITSVEYGKAVVQEGFDTPYKDMMDEDGKVTYIKLGMEISGDENQLASHTFYPYQGDIIFANGETAYASTSFGDLVGNAQSLDIQKGYVYFIVNQTMPIEQFTFKSPAPFGNENKLSISDDYMIEVNLPYEE